jgi:hypothetical protein
MLLSSILIQEFDNPTTDESVLYYKNQNTALILSIVEFHPHKHSDKHIRILHFSILAQ